MQEAIYTIVMAGKPTGPYTLDELIQLNIKPGTFVRKPGMDDYKEAHAIAELRELLGFRHQQTAPQYFAAFDQRLLATAIDYFFITGIFVIIIMINLVMLDDPKGKIAVIISYLPGIPAVKFIYSCIAEASAKQGTIGKRFLNIKVTDMLGNRISLANATGRNMAKVFSTLPVFFGYLYSFLNKKAQCWHDIIADTLVIKDRLV